MVVFPKHHRVVELRRGAFLERSETLGCSNKGGPPPDVSDDGMMSFFWSERRLARAFSLCFSQAQLVQALDGAMERAAAAAQKSGRFGRVRLSACGGWNFKLLPMDANCCARDDRRDAPRASVSDHAMAPCPECGISDRARTEMKNS